MSSALAQSESTTGYSKPSESMLQRQLRVVRLRRLVATGRYKVNVEALASALLDGGTLSDRS